MTKIFYCLKIRKDVTGQIEYFKVWRTANFKSAFEVYWGTKHKQVGIVVVLLFHAHRTTQLYIAIMFW